MSILIDSRTRVVVQGITGREGSFQAQRMLACGTKVVAGVTPLRGGEEVAGIPVFDSVSEAVAATRANTSVIFVPAASAVDAIVEAVDAGIHLVVCITEGIPALDVVKAYHYAKIKRSLLIGPNCPGLITPGQSNVGITPADFYAPGPVGVVSRSGTLSYEMVGELTKRGIGQSTSVGIGGDPIVGSPMIDILTLFKNDPQTRVVALIGEIGGADEEEAARFIAKEFTKPVVAFIAGRTAPAGKRMGHAGAVISGGYGTAEEKIRTLEAVGVTVARTPDQMAEAIAAILRKLDEREAADSGGGARPV
jgi:succinyl-CoA synthetase alpha subunit